MGRRLLLPLLLGWPGVGWADDDPGEIRLYPTHGTPTRVLVQGRFLEAEGTALPLKGDGRLQNLIRAAQDLESDEIVGALIRVEVAGQAFEARTDSDGVFRIEANLGTVRLPPGPNPVVAQAVEDRGHATLPALGTVYILPDAPAVAVISDFDDTVAISNITSKRALLRTALLENALQVVPVAGGAEAYRRAATAAAAVFYVTGSPQNFVHRINHFLEHNGYPMGPLELKNLGTDPTFDAVPYKVGRIQAILDAHPQVRFLLVGDSGEKDPEVYLQVRGRQPERILGIVIRLVPGGDNRAERFVGITAVPDFSGDPDVLLRHLKPAP